MSAPRPLIGLVAGLAAGLAATAVMAALRSRPASSADTEGEATGEARRGALDDPAPAPLRHYLTGALVGGAYGLAAEYWPQARGGFAGGYGLAATLLSDGAGAPGPGLIAPLVYDITLEGARTLLAGPR